MSTDQLHTIGLAAGRDGSSAPSPSRAMTPPPAERDSPGDRRLRKDLAVLVRFIELFCADRHAATDREPLPETVQRLLEGAASPRGGLCRDCAKLLAHAAVKRRRCPMDPKPACKKCPAHCYAPDYRARIREVMKHSGRRLVLRGRLDYLLHLWR